MPAQCPVCPKADMGWAIYEYTPSVSGVAGCQTAHYSPPVHAFRFVGELFRSQTAYFGAGRATTSFASKSIRVVPISDIGPTIPSPRRQLEHPPRARLRARCVSSHLTPSVGPRPSAGALCFAGTERSGDGAGAPRGGKRPPPMGERRGPPISSQQTAIELQLEDAAVDHAGLSDCSAALPRRR
jgi:hypothetical protein